MDPYENNNYMRTMHDFDTHPLNQISARWYWLAIAHVIELLIVNRSDLHWILLPKTAYIIIKIVDKPEQVDVWIW